MRNIKARISGTGMYIPPKKLTNQDLEKLMDTTDEWIRQRSGIENRHVAEGEGTSDLALKASLKALQAAALEKEEIDLILLATLSPDHQFPGSAAVLQAKLGLTTTPSMDIRCQCSGFIYALNVGKLFVESGQYKRVLVVGSETQSPVLDYSTPGRDVTVLFGDGAGAAVLEPSEGEPEIMDFSLHSQGEFTRKLCIARPGTADGLWITEEHKKNREHYPYMEGRFVFKHAVTRLTQVVQEVLTINNLPIESIDKFLFHQANLRINEKVASSLGIPAEKCPSNIAKYGNCSAGSIPILLDECVRSEEIAPGDLVLLAAFGAGFTWGATIIRF